MDHFLNVIDSSGRVLFIPANEVLGFHRERTGEFTILHLRTSMPIECKEDPAQIQAKLNRYFNDLIAYSIRKGRSDDDNLSNKFKM